MVRGDRSGDAGCRRGDVGQRKGLRHSAECMRVHRAVGVSDFRPILWRHADVPRKMTRGRGQVSFNSLFRQVQDAKALTIWLPLLCRGNETSDFSEVVVVYRQ